MKLVRYIGFAHVRGLDDRALATLGLEGTESLEFTREERVLDLPDNVADALLTQLPREFKEEPRPEEMLEEELTKDELIEEANQLGVPGMSKLAKKTKAEIATAILKKREELAAIDESAIIDNLTS